MKYKYKHINGWQIISINLDFLRRFQTTTSQRSKNIVLTLFQLEMVADVRYSARSSHTKLNFWAFYLSLIFFKPNYLQCKKNYITSKKRTQKCEVCYLYSNAKSCIIWYVTTQNKIVDNFHAPTITFILCRVFCCFVKNGSIILFMKLNFS